MRRQWNPFAGSGVGGGGFLQGGSTNAFVSGAIASGELCSVYETGAILRVNPALPWTVINNDFAGAVGMANFGAQTPFNPGSSVGHPKKLSNGTVVVPGAFTTFGFMLYTAAGTLIKGPTSPTSDTSTTAVPTVLPFPAGGFALIWNTATTVKFQIYDNFGNASGSVVTVTSSLVSNSNDTFRGEAMLAGGNFVIAYVLSTTMAAQQYTTAGATVGSAITIASVTGDSLACAPCANGDFLVAFCASTGTLFNLARVTTAGAVSWTATGSGTSRPTSGGKLWQLPAANRVFELSSTNIAWANPSSTNRPAVSILSSAGSAVSSFASTAAVSFPYPNSDVGSIGSICLTPNGFAFTYPATGGLIGPLIFFDPAGNLSSVGLNMTAPTAFSGPIYNYMVWVGTGIAVVTQSVAVSTSQTVTVLNVSDELGGIIQAAAYPGAASIVSPVPGVAPTYSKALALATGFSQTGSFFPLGGIDGRLFIGGNSSVDTYLVYPFTCARSSVLGVAAAVATGPGQQIAINGFGDFQLPSTQVFGAGASFDRRSSLPHGALGEVGGSSARLFGWS